MNNTFLRNAVTRCVSKFRDDRSGNVAMLFALTMIPMIGFTGAAVDYTRGNSARAAMQAAMDSTALMLSKDAQKLTKDQLAQKTQDYFKALFNRSDVHDVSVSAEFSQPEAGSFQLDVTGTAAIDTTFWRAMKVVGLGQDTIDLKTKSQVVWGMKKLELMLALDNTGSMESNSKMTELKKATRNLLDTLFKAAKEPGDVKVGIVPFATSVNVDKSTNLNALWLDWDHWEAEPANIKSTKPSKWDEIGPGSDCPFTKDAHGFTCVQGPATLGQGQTNLTSASQIPSNGAICPALDGGQKNSNMKSAYHNGCYDSVVSGTKIGSKTVCTGRNCSCGNLNNCSCTGSNNNRVCTQTGVTITTYTHTWRHNSRSDNWNGCVWDRNQDYDVSDADPTSTSTRFQPHQVSTCPASMLPLSDILTNWVSTDKDATTPTSVLGKKVDGMTPVGNTNVTIGLAWGWHALTKSDPLTEASTPQNNLDKVIILLTDGDNTQNRWSTNDTTIDARTKAACTNAKAAGFKLYTVRVINGNADLLRSCATNTSMYYDVENADDLNDVFTDIAKNLANLRIAK